VLLGLYLFLHIWVIHHIAQGEESFNSVMAVVNSPFFHLLEIGLAGTVAYHAVNGLRVFFIDYGNLARRDLFRKATYVTFAVSIVLMAIGAIPMVKAVLFGH
jgi:succinate dehydrogenase / fumarate reductase cytochrome b subunit